MEIAARNEAIARLDLVAPLITVILGAVQRLMQIADEVDEEGKRHQPVARRQRTIGDHPLCPRNLARHAIAACAGLLEVERLADVDILEMPRKRIVEPIAERLDTVGPDRRLLDRA